MAVDNNNIVPEVDTQNLNTPNPPAADERGLETQYNGVGASASQAENTDFLEDEYDRKVAQFRSHKFPLEHDLVMEARQVKVKTYNPKHFVSGSAELDFKLGAAVAVSGGQVTFNKTHVPESAWGMLNEWSTAFITGIEGTDGALQLFVTEKTRNSITANVTNAKPGLSTLPLGTEVNIAAYAAAESQMVVAPDNYQPVPKEVFLQKKLANIVLTKEWLNADKKADFAKSDMIDNALFNFKRKNARSHYLGSKHMETVAVGNNMADENVYYEEGVLRQVPMVYSYDDLGYSDLINVNQMQFTRFSASDTARAYCGKYFIQDLLNIDMTVHRSYELKPGVRNGIIFQSWTDNFGTIEYVYDPCMDDIGFSHCALVIDIKNAVHYVKRAQTSTTLDMEKGQGSAEPREAERTVYSIIDCVALRGYNAILICPASEVNKAKALGGVTSVATEAAALPSSPSNGDIVILTADNGGFKAGSIVWYNGTKWDYYEGEITA